MDSRFRDTLNEVLTDTYRGILRYEEQLIARQKALKLTIGEIHTLEVIGKAVSSGITISQIANALDLTAATVVVSVNRLEKKGFVEKRRDTKDRRHVFVTLTKRGLVVDRLHKRFHQHLVDELIKGFDCEEKRVLLDVMDKLRVYFAQASVNP